MSRYYTKVALLAVVVCCSYSWGRGAKLSGNEKVIRELLNSIVDKEGLTGGSEYLYRGKTSKGVQCDVTVGVHLQKQYQPKKTNGTSSLHVSISPKNDANGFWIGFGGEGPEGFAGRPTNSVKNVKNSVVIKSVDADEEEKFRKDWTLNLGFDKPNGKLSKLISVEGQTERKNDKTKGGQCGSLQFAVLLTPKKYAQIEKDINEHLDNEQKLEMFNGCTIGKDLMTLDCGYAIDQENNDQGSAVFSVGTDGSLTFQSQEMLEEEK